MFFTGNNRFSTGYQSPPRPPSTRLPWVAAVSRRDDDDHNMILSGAGSTLTTRPLGLKDGVHLNPLGSWRPLSTSIIGCFRYSEGNSSDSAPTAHSPPARANERMQGSARAKSTSGGSEICANLLGFMLIVALPPAVSNRPARPTQLSSYSPPGGSPVPSTSTSSATTRRNCASSCSKTSGMKAGAPDAGESTTRTTSVAPSSA